MRRDKTSLLLMEQLVTLMVFALAAAICLRAFVTADSRSRAMEDREKAAVLCQNAAETLRGNGGDFFAAAGTLNTTNWSEDGFMAFYDEDWQPIDSSSPNAYPWDYVLRADRAETDVPGLGKAEVWARDAQSGDELFRLEVAWQEVTADE